MIMYSPDHPVSLLRNALENAAQEEMQNRATVYSRDDVEVRRMLKQVLRAISAIRYDTRQRVNAKPLKTARHPNSLEYKLEHAKYHCETEVFEQLEKLIKELENDEGNIFERYEDLLQQKTNRSRMWDTENAS